MTQEKAVKLNIKTMNEEQKHIDLSLRNKKINFIKEIVSGYYKQPITDYDRKVRERPIIKLKYVTIYLILSKFKANLSELGKIFHYNHATIIHANKQITNYLSFDKELKAEISELNALIDHKLTIVNGKLNLNEDYHYVNLNDCVLVKQSDSKGVVLSGYNSEEVNDIINKVGLVSKPQVEFNNTGMYLLKKIEKNAEKTTEIQSEKNAEKPKE